MQSLVEQNPSHEVQLAHVKLPVLLMSGMSETCGLSVSTSVRILWYPT